jgi:tRNA-dihydrouridine synthase
VTKKGGGAELMRRPAVLTEILRALRRVLSIPFTVKIRAGWDDGSRNAVEIARIAEGEGAAMIAVHGRTRAQLYTGLPDWRSGDITAAEHALARLGETGVDGVMIGRAALAHPWIFRDVEALRRGEPAPPIATRERYALVDALIARLAAELPEANALGRARGLACRLMKHVRGGAVLREALTRAPSLDAMRALIAAAVDRAADACSDGDVDDPARLAS